MITGPVGTFDGEHFSDPLPLLFGVPPRLLIFRLSVGPHLFFLLKPPTLHPHYIWNWGAPFAITAIVKYLLARLILQEYGSEESVFLIIKISNMAD